MNKKQNIKNILVAQMTPAISKASQFSMDSPVRGQSKTDGSDPLHAKLFKTKLFLVMFVKENFRNIACTVAKSGFSLADFLSPGFVV